jgi:ABC-2 type transport system permease protein
MMKEYRALFRIRFINSLQYRAAAYAGMLTQFGWAVMEIFAFAAFYRTNPAAFPMEFSQTVSYIWLQEAFIVLFAGLISGSEISDAIESGSIAYELVRPMDLYGRWICQFVANRFAGVGLRCVPILLAAFIMPKPYRMSLPPDIGTFALFLISSVLAIGVIAAFSMLIYVSVFYTLSFRGTRLVLGNLSIFLSGAIVPLPFFPAPIRAVVEFLPFAAMQNMPFRIFSGNIAGADALNGMLLQVFWLIALVIIGRYALHRALKKVIAQGG